MKKSIVRSTSLALCTLLLLLSLLVSAPLSAYALPEDQHAAIQNFIEEAQRISQAPGIAVSVVADGETHFFSAGVADRGTQTPACEDTLWDIGSSTKAFTSLGILYLEEQGLLSVNDSVADHLPWLAFKYNGRPVDMQGVRLYHFMHHTSGLPMVPGTATGSLEGGVRSIIDAELRFYPGENFLYANENTNILGLIIEVVSGQSYASFMVEHIFHPLGMTDTFANRAEAIATGRRATGHVTQFIFFTIQRDSPDAEAIDNLPAGYLVSSTRDMARWMEVQLGIAEDIPEIFYTIIPRSHQAGQSIVQPDGHFYAAGWIVSADQSVIEHGGTTWGFGSNVFLFPEETLGITVLSNLAGAHGTQSQPALNIKEILDGNLNQSYSILWTFQHLDVTFTIATVLGLLFTALFTWRGFCRRKQNALTSLTKKRLVLVLFWGIMALAMVIPLVLFAWIIFFIHSFLTMVVAFALLFTSFAWFTRFPLKKA